MKYKLIYGLVLIILLLGPKPAHAQDGWDWRDPNDFGFIDFGDNKVLGYNLVGLGLTLLLDKKNKHPGKVVNSVQISRLREYQRVPLSTLWTIDYRMGKRTRKYITLGGSFTGYLTKGSGIETQGIGSSIWFSWHILRKEGFRFSYENGVGPTLFFKDFPAGGTKFNFTSHYGLAFEFLIQQHWFKIQFTNIHISNAGIKGAERNPALDAIGLQMGYQF